MFSMSEPTMHKPIPMGTRVIIDKFILGKEQSGEVVGISFMNVIFAYIVLLDKPYKEFKAVSILGTYLTGEDGTSFKV